LAPFFAPKNCSKAGQKKGSFFSARFLTEKKGSKPPSKKGQKTGDKEAKGARAAPSLIQIVGGFFGMKKLIAISVVFVLLASAAFAADVSATFFGGINLLQGSSEKDADMTSSVSASRIRLQAEGQNDDGTFGGWVRFQPDWGAEGPHWSKISQAWGNAWWKPVDAIKILVGGSPDGFFDTTNVVNWGFYQMAGDLAITQENWAFGHSFYTGYGSNGLLLTIAPIDALAINVVLPYNAMSWDNALLEDTFKQVVAQVTYAIEGIGKIALTYQGGLATGFKLPFGDDEGDEGDGEDFDPYKLNWNGLGDGQKIYFSFALTAVENLLVELGFSYTMKVEEYQAPMGIGLGAKFDAGAFGIKARAQAAVAGTIDDFVDIPMLITLDVLPSFAANDNLTAFLDAGFNYFAAFEGEDDGSLSWHVAPYIQYAFDWSKGFWAGVHLSSTSVRGTDDVLSFKVPIGLYFSF